MQQQHQLAASAQHHQEHQQQQQQLIAQLQNQMNARAFNNFSQSGAVNQSVGGQNGGGGRSNGNQLVSHQVFQNGGLSFGNAFDSANGLSLGQANAMLGAGNGGGNGQLVHPHAAHHQVAPHHPSVISAASGGNIFSVGDARECVNCGKCGSPIPDIKDLQQSNDLSSEFSPNLWGKTWPPRTKMRLILCISLSPPLVPLY